MVVLERTAVGERLVDALGARDFEALRKCFLPAARLRALVPTAVREEQGPDAIAARFRLWFGDLDEFELVDSTVAEVSDRVQVRYRVRGVDPDDGPSVVEQHAYLEVEDGGVTAMNLVCSGCRPVD